VNFLANSIMKESTAVHLNECVRLVPDVGLEELRRNMKIFSVGSVGRRVRNEDHHVLYR
jgi:hypothetical protein